MRSKWSIWQLVASRSKWLAALTVASTWDFTSSGQQPPEDGRREESPPAILQVTVEGERRINQWSNWVARVLGESEWCASASVVAQTPPEELWPLIKKVGPELRLLEDFGVIRAVSYSNCTNGFDVLRGFITQDQAGKRLTVRERERLYLTVRQIGFLAADSNPAFAFVKAGCDPEFWDPIINWEASSLLQPGDSRTLPPAISGRAYQKRRLAGMSIQALGVSGRKEVAQLLYELREKIMADSRLADLRGDLVDAAYYDTMQEKQGRNRFRDEAFGSDRHQQFDAWIKTAEGRRWSDWSQELAGKTKTN